MEVITFNNIPTRDELAASTLEFLKAGISNSDKIREAIATKFELIIENNSGYWNESASAKFVNDHAWVLVRLGQEGLIRKVANKEYKLV